MIAGSQLNYVNCYVPTDLPLVGPYRTYFDVIFANRPTNGRLAGINGSLPVWQQSINIRTAAIQSALSAIHYAEEAHAKGEADLRTVLFCHEELYNQRRRFLDAVLQYNLDIAEYAVAIAPAGTTHEKLASMLIPVKQPERVSAVPGKSTFQTLPSISERSLRSDGWVPSTLKSLEPEATPTARAPQRNSSMQGNSMITSPAAISSSAATPAPTNPAAANPLGQVKDPFGTQPAGDRYNDRSLSDRYNFGR